MARNVTGKARERDGCGDEVHRAGRESVPGRARRACAHLRPIVVGGSPPRACHRGEPRWGGTGYDLAGLVAVPVEGPGHGGDD